MGCYLLYRETAFRILYLSGSNCFSACIKHLNQLAVVKESPLSGTGFH